MELGQLCRLFLSFDGTSKTCPILQGNRPLIEVGQVGQLSFDDLVGLRRLVPPYEEADQIEVGQLQICEKAYEIGNLVKLANFISMFRWDFEDSTAPYEETGPPIEVGQVGQLQSCKKAYETGNLAKMINLIKFFSCFEGTSKTCVILRGNRLADRS